MKTKQGVTHRRRSKGSLLLDPFGIDFGYKEIINARLDITIKPATWRACDEDIPDSIGRNTVASCCDATPAFLRAHPINQVQLAALTERVRRRVIRWFRLSRLLDVPRHRRHARLGEPRVLHGRFSSGSRSSTAMCRAGFRARNTSCGMALGPPLAPLTEAPASVVRFLKERERSQSSDMDTTLEIAKRVADLRMEWSPVHDTKRRLAQTLGDLGIPFAIAGAMAANSHRHRRTTADVDVLVRREDLVRFKDRWIGHGWLDFFEGSKGFRDTFRHPRLR